MSDFLALDLEGPDSFEAQLFGGPIGDHLDLARAASPVTHVRAGAPPFFIQHGEADTWVPFEQALRMEKAIRSVGGARSSSKPCRVRTTSSVALPMSRGSSSVPSRSCGASTRGAMTTS